MKEPNIRINCTAHLVNNIVHAILDTTKPSNSMIVKNLSYCRKLVKHTKRTNLNSNLERSLKADTMTRWNSVYDMIESILAAWEDIEAVLPLTDLVLLKRIDKPALIELKEFLEPFKKVTMELQYRNKCTIHLVLLCRKKILRHLTINPEDSARIKEMKNVGRTYLEAKWISNDVHKKTIFFHPEMKQLKVLEEDERADILQMLRDELNADETRKSGTDDVNASRSTKRPADSSVDNFPTKKQKTMSLVDEFRDDNADRPMEEIDAYIQSTQASQIGNGDLCEWWEQNKNRFPNMYKLSLKYLCVPATSALAESKFSISGYMINEKRTNLRSDNVNNLMFLKSFYDAHCDENREQ